MRKDRGGAAGLTDAEAGGRWISHLLRSRAGDTILVRNEPAPIKMEGKPMRASALVLSLLALGFALPASAEDKSALPTSGNFNTHTGGKIVGENIEVAQNHIFAAGNYWGAIFNDAGSGPLHMGANICPYVIDTMNGAGTGQGVCSFGDANGDKIFTSWSAKVLPSGSMDGTNTITGGTGKFAGIRGEAPFHCQFLSDKGHAACAQQWRYEIASGARQ
jgi:hypothetical protein